MHLSCVKVTMLNMWCRVGEGGWGRPNYVKIVNFSGSSHSEITKIKLTAPPVGNTYNVAFKYRQGLLWLVLEIGESSSLGRGFCCKYLFSNWLKQPHGREQGGFFSRRVPIFLPSPPCNTNRETPNLDREGKGIF